MEILAQAFTFRELEYPALLKAGEWCWAVESNKRVPWIRCPLCSHLMYLTNLQMDSDGNCHRGCLCSGRPECTWRGKVVLENYSQTRIGRS